ncbi:MAG: TIR domain-containing protein [Lachnospira sp.]
MRIFLSHSSKDADMAAAICEALEKQGYSCFIAPRDIRSGYEYAEEIINGIDSSTVMLLLLSRESNESPHVLREVERAVSKKIPIIVYKLEDVRLTKSMEYFLMTHQWINADVNSGKQIMVSEIVKSVDEYVQRNVMSDGVTSEAKQEDTGIPCEQPHQKEVLSRNTKIVVTAMLVTSVLALVTCSCLLLTSQFAFKTTNRQKEETTDNGVNTVITDADDTGGQADSLQTVTDKETKENAVAAAADVKLGATIVLGRYNNQPIDWRVIKISDDGNQAMLIADNILTIKAYDAAESGTYNYWNGQYYWDSTTKSLTADSQTKLRGSNKWADSNIRTWLNSTNENVVYNDQAPTVRSMSDMKNGYDTEAGFLKNFSEEERTAILTTSVSTNGVTTQDKVFLLSKDELSYLETADVTKYPVPTQEAAGKDQSGWYKTYSLDCGVQDHYWWLRDADTTSYPNFCECFLVANSYSGGTVISKCVGLEGFGIRPAMTVDLTSSYIMVK